MNLMAGDKVRFLDEKGEGVITRFIDNRQVMVQMEDGFEIPYLLAKLVPVAIPSTKATSKPERVIEKQEAVLAPVPVTIQNMQTEGVYLVYLPTNPASPLSGCFEVLVFNMTSLHIQFSISTRHIGKFTCEYAGTLTPRQSCRIREIAPAEIERWSVIRADIQFFSYDPFIPRDPVSRLLKQKPARFYKESSFTHSGFTSQPAITVDLTRSMQKGQEEEYFEEKELNRIVFEKEQKPEKPLSRLSDKNNSALEWEIDLHVEELLDNIRGMSNGQIIDIQLKHFQKKLDEAIAGNIRKVVFIHGVGNGRLKGEIRKILETYRGLRVHDASYARYGFGATEVELT